jgi:hypothetical protein
MHEDAHTLNFTRFQKNVVVWSICLLIRPGHSPKMVRRTPSAVGGKLIRIRAEMEMKKLHIGTMLYGWDSMDEVSHQLLTAFGDVKSPCELGGSAGCCLRLIAPHKAARRQSSMVTGIGLASRGRRDISTRLKDAVLALAVCHNVSQ